MFDHLIVTFIVSNTKKIISICSIFFVFSAILFCSQLKDFFSVSQITGMYTSFESNIAWVGFHHARVGAWIGFTYAQVGLNLARVGPDQSRVGIDYAWVGLNLAQVESNHSQVDSNHYQVGFQAPYLAFNTQIGSNTAHIGLKDNNVNFKMPQVYNNNQVGPLTQVNFYIQVNSYTQVGFAQVGSYTHAQVGSYCDIYTPVDSHVQVGNQTELYPIGSANIAKLGPFVQIGNIARPDFKITQTSFFAQVGFETIQTKSIYIHIIFELYIRIMSNLFNYLSIYHCTTDIVNKCLFVKMKLQQNLFRKHDFKVYLRSINLIPTVENGAVILFAFMFLHFTVFTVIIYYLSAVTWKLLRICKTKNTKFNAEIRFACIGGGKANIFSYDELMPEATSDNMHSNSAQFKFVSYMLKNEALLLDTAENVYVVMDYPFEQLTPKLTITDLKIIAANHSIFVHSKMNHISIQTAIQNHVCSNCSTYTSVFKLIDDKAIDIQRKSSHMKILKKSKKRKPSEIWGTKSHCCSKVR
jgi:hypothetical protein